MLKFMNLNTRFVTFTLNDFDAGFRTFCSDSLECGFTYCFFFRFKSGVSNITGFDDDPIIFKIHYQSDRDNDYYLNDLLLQIRCRIDEDFEYYSDSDKPDSVDLLVVSFKSI